MYKQCRICLRNNKTVVNSLESCLDIIKELAQIEIYLDENLPNLVCTQCVDRLLDAHAIKEMCIKSEEYFINKLSETIETIDDDIEFKDEIEAVAEDVNFKEESEENIDDEFESFKIEVMKHNGGKVPIRCCVCDEYFLDESELENHCLELHKLLLQIGPEQFDSSKYQCRICNHTYSEARFWSHNYTALMAKEGKVIPPNIKEGQLMELIGKSVESTCCQCDKTFATPEETKRHLNHDHAEYKPVETTQSSEKLQCNICLGTFSSVAQLLSHSEIEKKLFPCAKCGEKIATLGLVKIHYENEHPGELLTYKCNQCEKMYNKYCSIYSHIQRFHGGQKKNMCDICGVGFLEAAYLRHHIDLHKGIKKYSCDICSKKFPTKTNVRLHMRCHTGEKPYKCSYCGKCYGAYTDWKTHLAAKHTGEWSLYCPACNRGFMKPSQLKIHQKTHK